MIKSYAYLRVSGKSQIDGLGFDRQEETIKSFSEKAGYEIVQTFREEGISGTADKESRPAFQEMLAAILSNGVRVVIVERLDRLAREYRIQETLLIYMVSKGITLMSAATEEDVTASISGDPMKKAIVAIQGIFAELEKNLLVKKLKNARERKKASTGKCEGRRGYSELNQQAVLMAKFLKDSGMTYAVIAEELNASGHKAASGGKFTARRVQDMLRAGIRRKATCDN